MKLHKCPFTNKVMLTKDDAYNVIHKGTKSYYDINGNRRNKFRRKKNEKRMYFCKECGSFHLTSWETLKKR